MRALIVAVVMLASSPAIASGGYPEPAIEHTGNATFTTAQIRDGIDPQSTSLIDNNGDIVEEAVEREGLLISAFYWDHGYALVKVAEPKIDRGMHRVAFTIEEGPRFTISTIRVTGTLLRTERNFLAMLATKPGAVFSRSKIADDREKLSKFYEDRAYAYANVLPLTKIDLAKRTIGLTFEIDQGELSFVDKIVIAGNVKVAEHLIRDHVLLKANDPYNRTRLEASRRRLLDLELFSDVAISTRRGSSPTSVEVTVEVTE